MRFEYSLLVEYLRTFLPHQTTLRPVSAKSHRSSTQVGTNSRNEQWPRAEAKLTARRSRTVFGFM